MGKKTKGKKEIKLVYCEDCKFSWGNRMTVESMCNCDDYNESCMLGTQKSLETPPVEDAEHLAEEAWKEMQDKDISFNIINTGIN